MTSIETRSPVHGVGGGGDGGAGGGTVHFRSARQRRGPRRAKMSPPLTPMIDVTFQLLLFFILTMNFRVAEGQIPADLPAQEGQASGLSVPLDPITVTLSRSTDPAMPVVEISRYPVQIGSWTELYQRLDQMREQFTDQVEVIIRPSGDVEWQHVVNAYNQAARAKFKTVAFAPAQ